MAQTITYIYDDPDLAHQAVSALESAGFTSSEISIVRQDSDDGLVTGREGDSVADGATTGASLGLAAGAGAGLLASLGIIAIPGLGPLVAAGVLATTLAAGAAGAVGGGIIGALVDYGISEEDAPVYAEGLRRGGTLVSVRVDDSRVDEAELILQRFSPVDIGARGTAYRDEGWTGYDPDAPAYTSDQIEAERRRYRM
jgi:hypothetical protein